MILENIWNLIGELLSRWILQISSIIDINAVSCTLFPVHRSFVHSLSSFLKETKFAFRFACMLFLCPPLRRVSMIRTQKHEWWSIRNVRNGHPLSFRKLRRETRKHPTPKHDANETIIYCSRNTVEPTRSVTDLVLLGLARATGRNRRNLEVSHPVLIYLYSSFPAARSHSQSPISRFAPSLCSFFHLVSIEYPLLNERKFHYDRSQHRFSWVQPLFTESCIISPLEWFPAWIRFTNGRIEMFEVQSFSLYFPLSPFEASFHATGELNGNGRR